MGEASARARPENSLLEEDLDFEHVQKVTPVITEETVRTLEELIKKRILDVSLTVSRVYASCHEDKMWANSDSRTTLTRQSEYEPTSRPHSSLPVSSTCKIHNQTNPSLRYTKRSINQPLPEPEPGLLVVVKQWIQGMTS